MICKVPINIKLFVIVITTGKNLNEQEEWKIMLDGRKKNGWLENFGHKDQSIDSIFQDKICQPFNNLLSGSKVWEKTVFDCMVCRSRVEFQMIRKAFMIYIFELLVMFGSEKFEGKWEWNKIERKSRMERKK